MRTPCKNFVITSFRPQKVLPCVDDAFWALICPHLTHSATCGFGKKKQKKKEKRQWQTGYLLGTFRSLCRNQSSHAGWPPVCSSIDRVLLKSVQWFCRCGWSKISHSHYFGHWLIQQLVRSTAYTTVQAVNCHCLVNKVVSDARWKRIRDFYGCETCRFVKLQLTLQIYAVIITWTRLTTVSV